MTRFRNWTWAVAIAAGFALLGLGGCANDPATRGYRVADKFSDEADALDSMRDRARAVLANLQDLMNAQQEELKPVFRYYKSALSKFEKSVNALDAASTDVNRWGQDYLDRPGKPGDVSSTSTGAQQAEVRKALAQITADYQQLGERAKPILATLQHVQAVMKSGLTVENRDSLKGAALLVPEQFQPARPLLAKLASELRALGSMTADLSGGQK